MISKKIGFIGFGNMGSAILNGAIKKEILNKDLVYVFDVSENALQKAREIGVNTVKTNEELCEVSDIILLAVKPQYVEETLKQTKKTLAGKTIFSIVAGVTIERLKKMIDGDVSIIRVMPNTPAMVFEGAFALCKGENVENDYKEIADELFGSIGIVEWLKEYDIDAVCGLSGGGPAYVAMFIEAMADAGVKQGLSRKTAYRLSAQTVLGTAKMIRDLDMHPGQLKDMVTSPGGTTIEGCEALEKEGMRYAIMKCVKKATEKSRKL